MVGVLPLAIVGGVVGVVALIFYSFNDFLLGQLSKVTSLFSADLERAGLRLSNERILMSIAGFCAIVWLLIVVLLKPNVQVALILLASVLGGSLLVFRMWLKGAVKKRIRAFNEQIEMVLRMMSNGLRVGLGLRQAIVLVTENLDEPARGEFLRVFGQTNIGVPLDDALAALVVRMPSEELSMMVSAIEVQSQTGGNLAKILDHLAATIKARRGVRRKIQAMTGEAVAGAWVLGSLPVIVGLFIVGTQATMRNVMISTSIGHLGLTVFCVLEGVGVFTLTRLMAFDI